MKKYIAIILCMVLFVTACGNGGEAVRQELKEKTNLNFEGGLKLRELDEISYYEGEGAESMRAFAVESVKKTFTSGENYLYSPASLYLALALAGSIADEDKVGDIYELFGVKNGEELKKNAGNIMKALNFNNKGQILRELNSIWIDDSIALSDEGEKILSDAADALFGDVYQTSIFKNKDLITKWVSDRTDGFLPNYQPTVDEETVMALYNVLYLKLKWVKEFNKKDVSKREFTLDNGDKVEVDMIHSYSQNDMYYKAENSIATKLYYQDGSYCLFIRPEGDCSLETVLNNDLSYYVENVPKVSGTKAHVELYFPKLKYETRIFGLEKVVQSMGIGSIFEGGAYSKLEPSMYTSSINQTTKIVMDEKGTEAVAVTEMTNKCTAMPVFEELEEITIDLNRSYAYVIMSSDGLPLFVGAVENPEM